jgi:hypothetical protein
MWTATSSSISIRSATAWHLLGADEGNGFAKQENRDYSLWTSLMF